MIQEQSIRPFGVHESLTLEFKEAAEALPKSFFATVCAFLNLDGGLIVLGVADDGTVVGIAPDALDRMKIEIANLSNNPNVPHGRGPIDPAHFTPYPKNPTICKFLIQLGRYEQLGSGVNNVTKYLPFYAPGAGEDRGEVADEVMELPRVTKTAMTRHELQRALKLKGQANFRDRYLLKPQGQDSVRDRAATRKSTGRLTYGWRGRMAYNETRG